MTNKRRILPKKSENLSLGIVIKFLELTLLWRPSRTRKQTFIYYGVMTLTLVLALNHVTKVIMESRVDLILDFLQYSVYHIGVLKIVSFEIRKDKWEKVVKYISDKEIELMKDPVCRQEIKKYIKKIRILLMVFLPMCIIANFNFFGRAWITFVQETEYGSLNDTQTKYFSLWWPFEENTKFTRYCDMITQNVYGDTTSIYVLTWDCLSICLLLVFAGQLKVIRKRFVHALDCDDVAEQKRNLVKCHKHYLEILEYQELCNSLLAPVMFIYLMLSSSNFAIILVQMISYERKEFIVAIQYLVALLLELLCYYWLGNEVIVQSQALSYGIFESAWVDKSLAVKKEVLLLSISTTKTLIFNAGPFNEMSLATFVSILKASYSFFTLINQTK